MNQLNGRNDILRRLLRFKLLTKPQNLSKKKSITLRQGLIRIQTGASGALSRRISRQGINRHHAGIIAPSTLWGRRLHRSVRPNNQLRAIIPKHTQHLSLIHI